MGKLYLDTDTLEFRQRPKGWRRTYALIAAGCIAVAIVLAFALDLLSISSQELAYESENQALRDMLAQSQQQIQQFGDELDKLIENDRELYRVILQAEDIPGDIRQVGTGGIDPYADFDRFSLPAASALRHSASILDELELQISLQNASYRELNRLARTRERAMAELPTIKPTFGRMISHFGMRIHPISGIRRPHLGLDITTPTGTPVFATGEGVVHKIDNAPAGYGRHVVVEHREAGFRTLYAHLSDFSPDLHLGKRVRRGEQIALSGNTGYSVGPHLHYEVRDLEDRPFNPINFIINMPPKEFRQLVADANADSLLASMD